MLGRQIAIGFGIAVILPLLIYYGVASFSPAPRTQDYVKPIVAMAGASAEDRAEARTRQQEEQNALKDAQGHFSRILFYVSVPLGYVAILAGGFMPVSAVATGLIFGGMFTVINGHWGYWSFIADWQRFVSLLVAAGIVMAIAYRKMPARTAPGATPPV